MALQSRVSDACSTIDDAQVAVEKATLSYSRGGSLDAVTRANQRLADARFRLREIDGGSVRDDR